MSINMIREAGIWEYQVLISPGQQNDFSQLCSDSAVSCQQPAGEMLHGASLGFYNLTMSRISLTSFDCVDTRCFQMTDDGVETCV